MKIAQLTTAEVAIVDLQLNIQNPRFEPQTSQREALAIMAKDQGAKLERLAQHIAKHGLNPTELPIVVKRRGNNGYLVLEGNRRVAALKLFSSRALLRSLKLPATTLKRLNKLQAKVGASLPEKITCVVAPSERAAHIWIELRHTGENNGVGTIPWNGLATARFRGDAPEAQLLEIVKDSEYLDDTTRSRLYKTPITNIQRILKTPDARRLLGIEVEDNVLRIVGDEKKVTGRLAVLVSDIANKHIKVSQLDTKDQRVSYATAVAARPAPKAGAAIAPTNIKKTSQRATPQSRSKTKKRRLQGRSYLVPSDLALNIEHTRIAAILSELQQLRVENYVNSCAVLLRVFMEMSLEEYSKKHNISLVDTKKKQARDLSLKKKVLKVVDHLQTTGKATRNEMHGVRTLANSKDTVFSIDTWHAYVHNAHYHPDPGELKNNWDNIQIFFEKIWS